ncbi:MAG TPA: NAD-dependent protein deacylase [Candidatus Omnitrophota bacterium]|nr:NAD-dependent protein deacylase [Candidatus Omnitrophota bacterium]
MTDNITKAVQALKSAKSVLFITGAGISAESGLPTYRGVGGLYNDEETEDGIPVEMALAGEMLVARPEVTWKYLLQIERNCRGAKFNRAHAIIAEMESAFPRAWVMTQNVDGFHAAAGSKNLIEIHGNLHKLKCTDCAWRTIVKDFSGIKIPPTCPECGRPVRPDVVLFGEMLPEKEMDIYVDQVYRGFDICFWIGTTAVFPYVQTPLIDAKFRGCTTVEINPDDTVLSREMDIKIALGAREALEQIWIAFKKSY